MLARRFVSGFVIETDATFNTNALNLPLLSITGITNTSRMFVIAHCFITSESTDCFLFINTCLKELFFYDRCLGPQVIVGKFSMGLTAVMLQKHEMSRSEAGMELAQELGLQIKESGTTLQLCSWHAAQAVQKKLATEEYPGMLQKLLKNLIWAWIKSLTVELLEEKQGEILAKL